MADSNTPKRPIDAFVEYFNDIKPYHCKILEIIEKYNFTDDITVNIDESSKFNISIANDPVCKGVGFGYIWDDCCGFDALQCCDFGDCEGGFGLIFDNSDLVNSSPILRIDAAEGKITVPGDQSKDTNFQIKKIINPTSLSVNGDVTSVLNMSKIFVIVPMNIYAFTMVNSSSVTIRGNHLNQILSHGEVILSDAFQNNGTYNVVSASYNNSLNYTLINLSVPSSGLSTTLNGNLYVKSTSINNGLYAVDTYNFNGVDTIINLVPSVKTLSLESNPATIQFRTGFSINREVEIENNDPANNDEYIVSDVVYDPFQNITLIYLRNALTNDTQVVGSLNLYGYITQPGFDAGSLCDAPNKQTISVNFSEVLQIIKTSGSTTPTPTPAVSNTITPTPTPTPTPTVAPGIELNSGLCDPNIMWFTGLPDTVTNATITSVTAYPNTGDNSCSPSYDDSTPTTTALNNSLSYEGVDSNYDTECRYDHITLPIMIIGDTEDLYDSVFFCGAKFIFTIHDNDTNTDYIVDDYIYKCC